jgi:hypothetical protein
MCYSAQIWADYKKYVRHWCADIGIREFVRLYWFRDQRAKVKIPTAMDVALAEPRTNEERGMREFIGRFYVQETSRFEQELFRQRKRLADAERTLATKPTKAAMESKRIATGKTSGP